ncbi:MAG: hypothetical protein LBK54_10535 [Propionibacteriaceae bacterium]|jgi:hypothetical protein|nr:hypothetical protein [Propionibacteriaceae bacterium]
MPRRVNLPGAAELFRPTTGPGGPAAATAGQATGRVRHDEKITVYVSNQELIALEQARLTLRQAGVTVDRGRIVRAAIAAALEDLADHGLDADLVQRIGS